MFDGQPGYHFATQMSGQQLARPAHAHCSSLPSRCNNAFHCLETQLPLLSPWDTRAPYISFNKSLRDPGVVEVAYFQRLDEIKGRSKVVKNRGMAEAHFLQGNFFGGHILIHSPSFTSIPRLETCHFKWQERLYRPVDFRYSDLMFTTGISRHLLQS